MKISKSDLEWAAGRGIIGPDQAAALWEALVEREGPDPRRFDLSHVAYYLGALLVIGAMGWFMTDAWEVLGGGGIFVTALIYAGLFLGAGLWFKARPGYRTPAGLLFTMAVSMTPLAVYGLQRWTGLWAFEDPGQYSDFHVWVRGGWFAMEVATIAVGLLALRFFRFPFLTAPIAFALWYLSMDATPILFGDEFAWENRLTVSLWFGLAMIGLAYIADHRTEEDLSFWLYLFGAVAFWGGMSLMESDSELNKFLYCLINLAMMGLSVFLRRRVFLVFGAMGVFGYVGYLASDLFADALYFPVALSLAGLLIMGLGVLLYKRGPAMEKALIAAMPPWMVGLRPPE